jgi:hypothetical protein
MLTNEIPHPDSIWPCIAQVSSPVGIKQARRERLQVHFRSPRHIGADWRGIGTIKIPTAVALLRTGVLSNWYGVGARELDLVNRGRNSSMRADEGTLSPTERLRHHATLQRSFLAQRSLLAAVSHISPHADTDSQDREPRCSPKTRGRAVLCHIIQPSWTP